MISAIILAAGKGERAGFSENKILKEYNELPLLCYSLTAFLRGDIGEIIVACRAEDVKKVKALFVTFPTARICLGGETRGESVYRALKEAKGDIVLVHDAARPFVTQKVISDCIESVRKFGSGVCALPATDTTVIAVNQTVAQAPARETVFTVQTPQGFYREKLLYAYEQARKEQAAFTDESGVYGAYVEPAHLFIGARENKKLTFAEDFRFAERIGFGVDTHAFYAEGEGAPFVNFITLAGVKIPSDKILKAHSDGDVLVHALMDALLSAAGLRDIGYYFPDTDEKYRGANSMQLLKEVLVLIGDEGYDVKNVSISVLAETPRLAPYIEQMKENLSEALTLSPSRIGIAAGTNEKLGYVGEGKGITVYATVLCTQN